MRSVRTSNTNSTNHLCFVRKRQDNPALTFLYNNFLGQLLLPMMISKPITQIMGKYYDSKLSKHIIKKYIKKNHINMSIFKEKEYTSFNDFFTRERKEIVFSKKETDFCAPCDGYLSAYKIEKDSKFTIKNIEYTLKDLIQSYSLAQKYLNGFIYIFRLVPANYHRFHYFDDGKMLLKKEIPGLYHTVRPIALSKKQVFIENARSYHLLSTQNFGDVIYMEVGALGVGKIINHKQKVFHRGDEKGMFLFGGSTVILIFEKDILKTDEKLLKMSSQNYEAVVKCGYKIGERL